MSNKEKAPIIKYLLEIGGRDVLWFPDSGAACRAAHSLRDQYYGLPIKVVSSYNKVRIILQRERHVRPKRADQSCRRH